jgi:hypothetical protein
MAKENCLKTWLLAVALTVLAARQSIAADSLAVIPAHPTITDSIRLSVVIKNWNCCTQYSYDSTTVTLPNDSTITLSFTATVLVLCNDTQQCLPGKPGYQAIPVLRYKRGHLPAGNYSVYEQVQSCVDLTCSGVVVKSLIGKFTVSEPTATIFHQKAVPLEEVGKVLSGNGRVYDIRGALISPNRAGASRQTPGIYFIKPDERSPAKLKIWY